MSFQEDIFLRAVITRPETTKIMSQVFRPEWLKGAEYQPILQEIYTFLSEYHTPPTMRVLHEIFEKKDKSLYNARIKATLTKVEDATADLADVIYTVDQARDVAVSRSLMDLVNSPMFTEMNDEFDGKGQMREIEQWMRSFQGKQEDFDLDIKEAIDMLISEHAPKLESDRIPCGIDFVDKWCGGGLRPKNLAIILAPTGHGKSTFLMIAAHNISVQNKNVLFISNELSMEEMTERFLSRLSGKSIDQIVEDPGVGAAGMDRLWKQYRLNERLRLLEVNREISSDDIEALILKYSNIYGWRPDVIVLDFMERMCPTVTGVKRDQSWNWLGYIAKDLVRMAKRGNWLIWTAGQTNRRGFDARKEQSLEDAQGSVQHLQEAALVMAMRQIDHLDLDDDSKVLLQFKPLKMRHSKRPGSSIMVEAKLGDMVITNNVRRIEEWINKEDEGTDDNGKAKFPQKQ